MASEWAPLVHGRTLCADYRSNLIAVPEGFGRVEIEWALRGAEAALTRDGERWVVFGDDRFRVVGLACPASAVSADRNADEHGRPIRVFLGWVSRAPFSPLPPRNTDLFYPLFAELLTPRWHEKEQQTTWNRVVARPFDRVLPPAAGPSRPISLNTDPRFRLAWPDTDTDELWMEASRAGGPVSLAVGKWNLDQVANAPFLNAAVIGLSSRQAVPPAVARPVELPAPPPCPHTVADPPPEVTGYSRDGASRIRPSSDSPRPSVPRPAPQDNRSLWDRFLEFLGVVDAQSSAAVAPRKDAPQVAAPPEPPALPPPPPKRRFRWGEDAEGPPPPAGQG